jgi:hypothetical protein
MRNKALHVFIAVAALLLGVRTARAQSPCRPSDYESGRLIGVVHQMMRSTDARWTNTREAYQLPHVADSAVVLVTDDSVCAKADSVLNSILPSDVKPTTSVYVIRVGDRYLVEEPSDNTQLVPLRLILTLDTKFAVLARIAS